MQKEEQVLLELTEEKENQPEISESERGSHDILEDEFDREFWLQVGRVPSP